MEVTIIDTGVKRDSYEKRKTLPVYLFVTDYPDEPPVFERRQSFFQMDENPQAGYYIGQVKAEDGDVDIHWPISYHCAESYVRVDESTGRIYVENVTVFDRELQHQLIFEIMAKEVPRRIYMEVPPQNTTARVVISLTDENDEPPYFTIAGDMPYTIFENRGRGAEIMGPQITVYDNDEYVNTQWEIVIEPLFNDCPVEAVPNTGYHGALVTLKAADNFDYEQMQNCSINLKMRFYINRFKSGI